MRAFPGLEERERTEGAFYGSEEWRQGPREAILAGIESGADADVHRFDEILTPDVLGTPARPLACRCRAGHALLSGGDQAMPGPAKAPSRASFEPQLGQ
jgi:hypothetical protein